MLRAQFAEVPYEPIIQGEEYGSSFGGWSLLSHTGQWSDGMVSGREAFNGDKTDFDKAYSLGIQHEYNYDQKTQLCYGYVESVLDDLNNLKLNPRRARYTILKAGGQSTIHRDVQKDGDYSARLHIPIITNEKCTHSVFEDGKKIDEIHMPADGSVYLMWTNNLHQIKNESDEDRVHLMMSVWDENDGEFKFNSLSKLKIMANGFTSGLEYARKKAKTNFM